MRREILLSVFVSFGAQALAAQNSAEGLLNPVSTAPGGVRLQDVSVFITSYSGPTLGGVQGGGQTGVGGSATLGYSRFRDRTGISISYTPSYSANFQGYGTDSSRSNALSLSVRRKVTPRWTVSFSTSGVLSSLTEALFMPTALANVAGAPGAADELSAAMVAGRLTNGPLAAILTSAPVVQSPSGLRLYGNGNRFLSSTAQSNISYGSSSRLTFHMSVEASRSQALKDSGVLPDNTPGYPLLAHTTAGSGGIGVSYSITPRTQLSADLSSSRAFSNLQDAFTSSAAVSLGHVMSPNWFLQAHAGSGFISPIREYRPLPKGAQYQAGGGIGYRREAHTFLVSVDRSFSDGYGIGAGASVSATGAWSWRRPGASWSTTASFGQQRLTVAGFNGINSWRASAGLQRKFGQHISLSTEFAYLSGLRSLLGPGSPGGQQMVRMSVSWSPNGRAATGN